MRSLNVAVPCQYVQWVHTLCAHWMYQYCASTFSECVHCALTERTSTVPVRSVSAYAVRSLNVPILCQYVQWVHTLCTHWTYQYCVLYLARRWFGWTEMCRQVFNIDCQYMLCYWLNKLLYYWKHNGIGSYQNISLSGLLRWVAGLYGCIPHNSKDNMLLSLKGPSSPTRRVMFQIFHTLTTLLQGGKFWCTGTWYGYWRSWLCCALHCTKER